MADFDIFLSHNSRDKPAIERIAEKLKRERLEPWVDKWCLTPGSRWQDELVSGLRASATCAFFIGPNGVGDWASEELNVALDRAAKDRAFRVFLVLLPGVPEPFDATSLPPFLSTRTWVDLRMGIDDPRGFQVLISAIKGVAPGSERPIEPCNDLCPYRGLQTFHEEHVEFFFGRNGDIQRLVEKLKATRFFAVLGPSGSGKSSVVRAGLIPRLRAGALPDSDTWTIRVLTPGSHPLTALAAHLLRLFPQDTMQKTLDQMTTDPRTLHLACSLALAERPPSELVMWVIDQFEEVFTLCRDEQERKQFLDNLLYAASIPDGRSMVVLTMRADFYSRCAAYPALSALIASQQFLISPMDLDGLRQAIEEPAWRVGLEFEEGLVATVLDDVANEPGALPLLEHALLELWELRRGRMMTLEAYRETGGVHGALAKRADTVYDAFSPEQQKIVRRIMLRLTAPGEGTEDTRRRATITELVTSPGEAEAIESVVRAMADARLFTAGADEQSGERLVDVSHEALIRSWPRLRKWIDEDRASLRLLRRVTEGAQEWQRLNRDEGVLYRGARLAQAVEWRERNEATLNELERQFLDASVMLRDREQAGRQRLRRRVTLGLAAGMLMALLLAGIAGIEWQRAKRQVEISQANQLAAQARNHVDDQPDLALLLAVEACRTVDTVEARGSLMDVLEQTSRVITYLRGHTASVRAVSFSPNGQILASGGDDGTIQLWDAQTAQPVGAPLRANDKVECLAFSADCRLLASGSADHSVLLWDVQSHRLVGPPLVGHSDSILSVAFNPNGKTLASSSGRECLLWDLSIKPLVGEPLSVTEATGGKLAFSPDGRFLAIGRGGQVTLWDVLKRAPACDPLKLDGSWDPSLSFSPNGKMLAAADDFGLSLWNLGVVIPSRQPVRSKIDFAQCLAFSPDGKNIVVGSNDRFLRFWDAETGEPTGQPFGAHTAPICDVAFSPDGEKLASASEDGTVILWRAQSKSPLSQPLGELAGNVVSAIFSPDDIVFACSTETGEIVLWDLSHGLPIRRQSIRTNRHPVSLAFRADSEVLESYSEDGTLQFWEARTGQPAGDPVTILGGNEREAIFSPNGMRLAACVYDETGEAAPPKLLVWDTKSGRPIGVPVNGPPFAVTSLAFNNDGTKLAAGTRPAEGQGPTGTRLAVIYLWNLSVSPPVVKELSGHTEEVSDVVFRPDGNLLASCSSDETIRFWDTASGRSSGPVLELFNRVTGVAFSGDGQVLASQTRLSFSYEASVLQLWDVSTGKSIGQPRRIGHNWFLPKAPFNHSGTLMATIEARGEKTALTLWDTDVKSWQERACNIANRNLSRREWLTYFEDRPYHRTKLSLPEPLTIARPEHSADEETF